MKTSDTVLRKIYLTLYLKGFKKGYSRFYCERDLETDQNCNILTSPAPPDIVVCRSRSLGLLNRGPVVPASLGHVLIQASSHQLVWSPKLTDLLSSPSYLIAQSPTQYIPMTGHWDVSLPLSLEWHVWLSSSGNNCNAVHRSLSSSASVYDYRGILPCPILPARLAHANGICTSAVFGMACLAGSKVNIQHIYLKEQKEFIQNQIDNIRDLVEDKQSKIAWQTIN